MLQLGLIILDEYCILIKLEHTILKSLIFVFYFSCFFLSLLQVLCTRLIDLFFRICIVFALVRDDFSIFSLRKVYHGYHGLSYDSFSKKYLSLKSQVPVVY